MRLPWNRKYMGNRFSRHSYRFASGGDDCTAVAALCGEKCHITDGGDIPRRFCARFLGVFLYTAA